MNSMSGLPHTPQRGPYVVTVRKGEKYSWCACGLSATQPFCDGSHKGTEMMPVRLVAEKDEEVYFCGCKHSGNKPYCDGSHENLASET